MNMKNILVALVSIMATGLAGCYKLDRVPFDKPSSISFWQTDVQSKEGIMGVYTQLKNYNVFGISFSLDCISDIGVGYDYFGYNPEATAGFSSRSVYANWKWQATWEGVLRANDALQKIGASNGLSPEVKKLTLAEAHFLRALYYFHLWDYFGGLPLYDETVNVDEQYSDMKKPRSSSEETMAFIIADLDKAAADLPEKWPAADYGRATKGAAIALRGKTKLYGKKYQEAATDFESLVTNAATYGYSLYPNYADLFTLTGHTSGEIIFAVQNLGGIGTSSGMPMGIYMGSRSSFGSCWNNSMASTTLADMYEMKDGSTFNWNDFIPGFNENATVKKETFIATLTSDGKSIATYPKYYNQLMDIYTQRDPRMAQTLILPYSDYLGNVGGADKMCKFVPAPGANETNGFVRNNVGWYMYLWRKFVPAGNMGGKITDRAHTPINFPIIRYADVLLMLAECYNELNRPLDAVTYINMVRQRSSTNMPALNSGPAYLAATTKEAVFQRIVKERAVEFAAEGIRLSDLRRWGIAQQLLSGKVETQMTGEPVVNKVFAERNYLWPIPGAEIEMNPALTQNPGW